MAIYINNDYGKTAILSSEQRIANLFGLTIYEIKKENYNMGKTYLASVATAQGFVKDASGNLIHALNAKTLTESTLGFTSTMEEVRAGVGGKLYGRFNHSTGMTVSLTDAMFDVNYIKYQIGAESGTTGTIIKTDANTFLGSAIKGTGGINLAAAPQAFGESCGLEKVAVWFRPVGCAASGNDITIVDGQNGTISGNNVKIATTEQSKFVDGTTYCASYVAVSTGAEMYNALAEFNPSEMILIMTANLYSGDANNAASGSKYGTFTVKIPRFQLDGAFDLSMAMTSAATLALNGTALAVNDGSCEDKGVYAEIVVAQDAAASSADFMMIAFDNNVKKVGDTPVVYGLKKNGVYSLLNNADLTFSPVLSAGKFSASGETTVTFGTLTADITVDSAS